MRRMYLILMFIAGLLAMQACGPDDGQINANDRGGSAGNPSTNSTVASVDRIGVAECDEYIQKYEACINSKVPESMRASVKDSLEAARKMWKDAAATPQGKAGLATACKQALETAKSSMGSYGCSW